MTGRVHDEPLTLAAYAILNEPGDQARNYHQALGLFEHAERLGVEGVWVRQFHLRHPEPGGGLPSPFVFLAWLAARTRRLRLGTAAVTLPLESPLRWRRTQPSSTRCPAGGPSSGWPTAEPRRGWRSCSAARPGPTARAWPAIWAAGGLPIRQTWPG